MTQSHPLRTALFFALFLFTCGAFAQMPAKLITGGAKTDDFSYGIAADSLGNSYTCGSFSDTLWMGGSFVVSSGGSDAFIAKHDAAGNLVWLRKGGGPGNDLAAWTTVFKDSYLYVTGEFNQTASFSGKSIVASGTNDDCFIAKYDLDGNIIWLKGGGSASLPDRLDKIAFSGNTMYVPVTLGPSATFCGASSLATNGNLECYVMKMDTAANMQSYAYFGGASNDYINELVVDKNNNLVVTGNYFSTTFKVGTSTFSNMGNYDLFYVKLDSSLNFKWAITGGGTNHDEPEDTRVDDQGNIYSTGHIYNGLKIGSTTYYTSANSSRDAYVLKLGPTGNVIWVKGFGGSGDDDSRGLILDPKGRIHLTGHFHNTLNYGFTSITANGSLYDLFMAGVDTANGALIYLQKYGGKGDDMCNAISLDRYGVMHVGGFHTDTTTFSTFSSPTRGGYDATIWRFSTLAITANNIIPTTLCRTASAFTWPLTFTQENSYPAITGYRALLSDSNGSFASPLVIGTAAANATVITISIPPSIPDGGDYRVRVEALNAVGNFISNSAAITMARKPLAAFTVANPVQCFNGHSMAFTNTSTISTGSFSNLWNYGDNTTSTAFNETRSYATSGIYTVKLAVTSAFGCKDSVNHNVKVYPTPEASIISNSNTTCQGDSVMLKATNMVVYHHQWFFNGSPISGDTLKLLGDSVYKHYAKTTGSYQVRTTNDYGCDSLSGAIQITVNPNPVAAFSATPLQQCLNGNSTSFTNSSSVSSGTFSNLWKYGDNTTSTASANSKSFNSPGTYTISLLVTSAMGCKDSVSHSVTINPSPAASVSATTTSVCQGDSVTLNAGSTSGISQYQWYYNNAAINGPSGSTYYANISGAYKLKTSNSFGCDSVSDAVQVTIKPLPVKPVVTRSHDTLFSSTAPSYQWIKNNTILTGETGMFHVLTSLGTYFVIVDSNGCAAISDSVQVNGIASAMQKVTSSGLVHIYPNPSGGKVHIETTENLKQVTVTNMLGELIYTTGGDNKTSMELNLAKGVYMVLVNTNKGLMTQKLIVQ